MGGGIIFAFFSRFFFTDLLSDCREARKNFVPLGTGPNLGPKLSLKAENGQKWGPKCKNRKNNFRSLFPTQWTTNGRNFKKKLEKKVPSRALGSGLGYGQKWGFWPFLPIFLVKSHGNQLWDQKMPHKFYFEQWSGPGGQKWPFLKAKIFFPPNFSFFWS